MTRKISACLKAVPFSILAAGFTTEAYALGVRLPDQDAFATGRGEAFVATADNPSAIYYNPAGITQLDGQNVRVGVYGIAIHDRANNVNGSTSSYNTDNGIQAVPQFFYTISLNSIGVNALQNIPVTLGLGVYAPYGLSMNWGDNTSFAQLGTKASVDYISINPVVAWQIIPNLSVAAGLTINYAETELELQSDMPGAQTRFEGHDTVPGFNLGLMYKPIEEISLGLNYRSETKMNFHGTASELGGGPLLLDQTVASTAPYAFPQNAVAGISFRPTPKWNFEFDADWTDWHQLKFVDLSSSPLLFNGFGGPNTPYPTSIQQNWRSSWFFEFGATRYFDNGLHVSGGYIYSQNSVPDQGFFPLIPDSDRHIFSLGLGGKYHRWTWDATYQLSWGPDRTVNQTSPPVSSLSGETANGTYQFLSHAIILSAGYHF